jgi:hypothetical protein
VIAKGDISPRGDRDWFKLQLDAGDVIAGLVNGKSGLNSAVRLVNAASTLLMGSDNTFLPYAWPAKSPVRVVPSDFRDANFVYVINTPGMYLVEVAAASDASIGKYAMDLVVARPGLESEPIGTKQILFIDFDGAKVNASKFSFSGTTTLSPLAAFLPAWGLTAADENAVMTWKLLERLTHEQDSNGTVYRYVPRALLAAERAWFRPSSSKSRATSAVQPVWWVAPTPRPVSPWKYSWKRMSQRQCGSAA